MNTKISNSAESKLLLAYEETTGKKPNEVVKLLCSASAGRVESGEKWRWVVDKSTPNWSEQLHWG